MKAITQQIDIINFGSIKLTFPREMVSILSGGFVCANKLIAGFNFFYGIIFCHFNFRNCNNKFSK